MPYRKFSELTLGGLGGLGGQDLEISNESQRRPDIEILTPSPPKVPKAPKVSAVGCQEFKSAPPKAAKAPKVYVVAPGLAQALRTLKARRPERIGDHRWRQAAEDGRAFLARWGDQAQALGWTADDLFGLHPVAPLARYDVMGLAWLIRGRAVVALTENSAVIEHPNASRTVYRRQPKPRGK